MPKRAKEARLQWPVDGKMDTELEVLLFPEKQVQISTRGCQIMSGYPKNLTATGLRRNSFSWSTARNTARPDSSRLCIYKFPLHSQQYAEKNRAIIHIPRKPGNIIEVDWAGDKLYIVDRDTDESNTVYLFVGLLVCCRIACTPTQRLVQR